MQKKNYDRKSILQYTTVHNSTLKVQIFVYREMTVCMYAILPEEEQWVQRDTLDLPMTWSVDSQIRIMAIHSFRDNCCLIHKIF